MIPPVDYAKLLRAADDLITAGDAIELCPECGGYDFGCPKHNEEFNEAYEALRKALGRNTTRNARF